MKQVVIFKNSFRLSPYFIVKLLTEKRESPVYCYEIPKTTYEPMILVDTNKTDFRHLNKYYTSVLYADRYLGKTVYGKDVHEDSLIDISDIYENREDPELIKIIQEINNENIAKIIIIPEDVSYFIAEEHGDNEYVQEYGRSWK